MDHISLLLHFVLASSGTVQGHILPRQSWGIANPATALLPSSRACTLPRGAFGTEESCGLIASHPAGPYKPALGRVFIVPVGKQVSRAAREALTSRTSHRDKMKWPQVAPGQFRFDISENFFMGSVGRYCCVLPSVVVESLSLEGFRSHVAMAPGDNWVSVGLASAGRMAGVNFREIFQP